MKVPRVPSLHLLLLLAAATLAWPLRAALSFDAEAGLPHIRNFPPEAYQGHNQVFATAEAPDGVMYFAIYGAVVSFDGERWRHYPVTGTWIRALVFGPDGLLYLGGGNTLGRLEPAPDTGLLRFVSLVDRLPAAQREFGTVWSAAPLAPNAIAFGIDGALLTWRDGAFHVSPFPGQRPALRPAGDRVFCHVGDRLLEWRDRAWHPFATDPRLAAARRLTALPHTATGLRLALDNGTLLQSAGPGAALAEWPSAAREFLRIGLRNGLRLRDGTYVLSTAGSGLVFLDDAGTPVRRLTGAHGLAHSATYGLALARDGALWVETANGLSHFHPLAPWTVFDPRNGRPENNSGGPPIRFRGQASFDLADTAPMRLHPARDGLDQARLELIHESLPARMACLAVIDDRLFAAAEQGVMRVDGTPKIIHRARSQLEHLHAFRRVPGIVVIGQLTGAEWVRIAADDTVTPLGRLPGFEVEITNIVELADGTLWLGSTAGMTARLRLHPDGTLRDSTRFDASQGLPRDAGWVKVVVVADEVIVCVKQGAFRLDPRTDRFVPHPWFAEYWPAGVNTLPIATDGANRIWFQIARDGGFQLGCLHVGGARPRWQPLPAEIAAPLGFSGARSLGFEKQAARQTLWVGGRAMVRVDLDALAASSGTPSLPTVVLSEFRQGTLVRPARAGVTARFPFAREPLHVSFSSPAAAGAALHYETRLLGLGDTWTRAAHPDVSYTNLSGGPFTLEVRARDTLGHEGPPARVSFHVAPPWHRTSAAYSLYVIAGLGAMLGFIRWRLNRAEHERRRLERLVAQRTAELASARDQAEAASRAKSAFLASMSHELRTPLNGVIGYAQVLQSDARLLPDQQERLRIVRSSGEHLLRMINDVLDLAKIEAGKLELRPAPFSLADLLNDIAAAHAPAAAAKRLAFDVDAAPDLPAWLEGDAQKLRQILDNLLGNAVKFTPSGTVTLAVTRVPAPPPSPALDSSLSAPSASVSQPSTFNFQLHGEALRFAVSDTGPGISAPDQARLFQPFEQATQNRGNAPGTGLGLAISRALVERMGGSLSLESTLGVGSTFHFTLALPAVAPAFAAGVEPLEVTGFEGPPRRVLIVDDHPVNRSLLVDLLQPLGFACTAVDSGEAALALLQNPATPWPDLAILDVRMEGLDGLELTRRLRTLQKDRTAIPAVRAPSPGSATTPSLTPTPPPSAAPAPPLRILLTSASVLTFNPAAGKTAGCDDFLPKPFRTAELIAKIGTLLALRWRETPPTHFHVLRETSSAASRASTAPRPPAGAPPASRPPFAPPAPLPLPPDIRATLTNLLDDGDLAAFRATLTQLRASHPDHAATWTALDEAAAAFQLPRLRHLLAST